MKEETTHARSHETVFVARQPIFDRDEQTWGYELLHRESAIAINASIGDGNAATRSVIADGFSLATEDLPQSRRHVLINFPEALLLSGAAFALPTDYCVVEILETVTPTAKVLKALRELKEAGYTLAMDDYYGQPELKPFLELADIVKIDVLALENDAQKIQEVYDSLVQHDALLLAEKVEDNEVYTMLWDMGFHLFQGFYFSKPHVVPGKKLTANETTKLQLLRELGKDDFELSEVADVLKTDPSLSFRLFRHINSAGFGLQSPVDTLDRAVNFMGQRGIAQWLQTAILSDLNRAPKAGELIFLSVLRAKFLELLAERMKTKGTAQPDTFFIIGLFSLLDSMLGINMDELLESLPLDEQISCALQGDCSEYNLLTLAHSFERGNWDETELRIKEVEMDAALVEELYVQARRWAQLSLKSQAEA